MEKKNQILKQKNASFDNPFEYISKYFTLLSIMMRLEWRRQKRFCYKHKKYLAAPNDEVAYVSTPSS